MPERQAAIQVTTRTALLGSGMSRRAVERDVRDRRLISVHRGIYVAPIVTPGDALADLWRSRLFAQLVRGGDGSAVSHRAAAIVHGFDGWTESTALQNGRTDSDWLRLRPEDITVPFGSTFRVPPAIRTRSLPPQDVVDVERLPVTTKARTLADLGRFLSVDDVELAMESALRIDPRRPDQWDEPLLADLERRIADLPGGRTGLAVLRAVLARRPPGARPTGSPAETRAIQALRPVGLDWLTRQATIRFIDRRGAILRVAFPDLSDLERAFLLEIDGAGSHGTASALDRDLRRQNDLTDIFTVARWSASRVRAHPHAFAHEVASKHARLEPVFVGAGPWTVRGRTVVRTAAGLDIYV